MTNKEIYERLIECAKSVVNGWSKTEISEIEKYYHYNPIVSGIVQSALYLLPTEEYFKFRNECRELGVNV